MYVGGKEADTKAKDIYKKYLEKIIINLNVTKIMKCYGDISK